MVINSLLHFNTFTPRLKMYLPLAQVNLFMVSVFTTSQHIFLKTDSERANIATDKLLSEIIPHKDCKSETVHLMLLTVPLSSKHKIPLRANQIHQKCNILTHT
jgi:hypothetical protein